MPKNGECISQDWIKNLSIKLDIEKLHLSHLLKLISSNISLYDYLNLIGDNALSRGATELRIYAEDNQDFQIHFIDNGTKCADFICADEIHLHDLSSKAPLIYASSAFTNFIELSYYKNEIDNAKISIDLLSNTSSQIEVSNMKVNFDYLIQMATTEKNEFNCLSIKNVVNNDNLDPRENFYIFLKKIKDNFTFRYHKLIENKKLKITFLPEKRPLSGYSPLFDHSNHKTHLQQIVTSGKFKCLITPHIVSKIVTKEDIQISCPSRSLDGSSGIYFYNANGVLLNKPDYFNLEQQLDIPITKKENLLKYIKIEINFSEITHTNNELCRIFLKDKNNKSLIKQLIEKAAKEVDKVITYEVQERPERSKMLEGIFYEKIKEFRSNDLSLNECYEELIKIYPKEDYKKIIKEIIVNAS